MAAERSANDEPTLTLHSDDPLIGVVRRQGDSTTVQLFTSEAEADAAVDDDCVHVALALAGAWSDLDWDDMFDALTRIRHSNPPSPPLSI